MRSESHIQGRIEFFLYAIPIVISLIGAVTILSTNAFKPYQYMANYFIGSDPTCENLECDKSNEHAKVLFVVLL